MKKWQSLKIKEIIKNFYFCLFFFFVIDLATELGPLFPLGLGRKYCQPVTRLKISKHVFGVRFGSWSTGSRHLQKQCHRVERFIFQTESSVHTPYNVAPFLKVMDTSSIDPRLIATQILLAQLKSTVEFLIGMVVTSSQKFSHTRTLSRKWWQRIKVGKRESQKSFFKNCISDKKNGLNRSNILKH